MLLQVGWVCFMSLYRHFIYLCFIQSGWVFLCHYIGIFLFIFIYFTLYYRLRYSLCYQKQMAYFTFIQASGSGLCHKGIFNVYNNKRLVGGYNSKCAVGSYKSHRCFLCLYSHKRSWHALQHTKVAFSVLYSTSGMLFIFLQNKNYFFLYKKVEYSLESNYVCCVLGN